MKKIAFDRDRFEAAGLSVLPPVGGVVTVILPGQQDLVRCKIVGDQIELYPERSSAQKLVAQALGLPV